MEGGVEGTVECSTKFDQGGRRRKKAVLEGQEVEVDATKSLELGAFLSVLGSAQLLSYLLLPAFLFNTFRTFP